MFSVPVLVSRHMATRPSCEVTLLSSFKALPKSEAVFMAVVRLLRWADLLSLVDYLNIRIVVEIVRSLSKTMPRLEQMAREDIMSLEPAKVSRLYIIILQMIQTDPRVCSSLQTHPRIIVCGVIVIQMIKPTFGDIMQQRQITLTSWRRWH